MEKDFETEKIRTVGRSVLKQDFETDVHIYFGSAVPDRSFKPVLNIYKFNGNAGTAAKSAFVIKL